LPPVTVKRVAEQGARGLREADPGLRKTVVEKLVPGVGAMIERQRPNTAELTDLPSLESERQDACENSGAIVKKVCGLNER